MKDVQFVSADNLSTLEQYGALLLSSMISLKTLESFHIAAYKKGLLDQDEEECSKTILWEIQRLIALYKKQLENIMNRCELDEALVMNSLKAMAPKSRSRKKKSDDGL